MKQVRADDSSVDLTGPAYWQGACDALRAEGLWVRAIQHNRETTPCDGITAQDAIVYTWKRDK